MSAAAGSGKDLPSCWAPVVETYGREMVALVMQAGMAQEAVEVLAAGVAGDGRGLQAVRSVAVAFNELSNAYIKEKGWTREEMGKCERELQVRWAAQLVGADGKALGGQGGNDARIILQ